MNERNSKCGRYTTTFRGRYKGIETTLVMGDWNIEDSKDFITGHVICFPYCLSENPNINRRIKVVLVYPVLIIQEKHHYFWRENGKVFVSKKPTKNIGRTKLTEDGILNPILVRKEIKN